MRAWKNCGKTSGQREQVRNEEGPPVRKPFVIAGGLRAFALGLPAMFGVLPWFRKVCISSLHPGVLVAMAQLALQAGVSGGFVIFGFRRALRHILIRFLLFM
jgi:hypothetical protein